jgi:hypothetical protein
VWDVTQLLGCVYIDLAMTAGYDAEVCLWARQRELITGLEKILLTTV